MNARHIEKDQCPVCGMDARESNLVGEHMGIVYHFCSEPCRKNFQARPTLYVGKHAVTPGLKLLKRRSLTLDQEIDVETGEKLLSAVRQMMGIHRIEVSGKKVKVEYDLKQTTAEQIEACLIAVGVGLGGGWGDRLKRGWIHYTEETELDNLDAKDSACCNRPPAKK